MTMSASFSWKMMRKHDGGDADRQHQRKGDLPEGLPGRGAVDLGGFLHFPRQRLKPGEQQDHDEGNPHPGIHRDNAEMRAIHGVVKKAGLSQPR